MFILCLSYVYLIFILYVSYTCLMSILYYILSSERSSPGDPLPGDPLPGDPLPEILVLWRVGGGAVGAHPPAPPRLHPAGVTYGNQ